MRRALVLAGALLLGAACPAAAHKGPPFPLYVDRPTGPYRLSVWADPDIGTGTFWIYLQSAGETTPGIRAATDLPESCAVEVIVGSDSAGVSELGYRAKPRRHRGARRFDSRVRFGSSGPWSIRFRLWSAVGAAEAETTLVATPPGQGPILSFILYLFPFVAVGFLFVKAALRRRQAPALRRR